MKKRLLAAAVLLLAGLLYAPGNAFAIPAFARQTGMSCNSCHFQHFPTLNAFGRAFKTGGYTMVGGESMVEGDFLSVPSVLNAALIAKIRYQKRNGDAQTGSASELNKGQVQFPDEAALFLAGRAGEHVGFLLESSLKDGDSRFTSFKMPVVYDVAGTSVSAIPFSTDGAGASYGFELMNTGAQRIQRPIEHRSQMSAQQYIGTSGSATGLTLALSKGPVFGNYTAWYPAHGDGAVGPFINYVRAAVMPNIGGWDVGVGVQLWKGTSRTGAADAPVRSKADAWAVDAQVQGNAGPLPLGLYLSYAVAKKSTSGKLANMYNSSTNKDKRAAAILAELGVVPNRLTVFAAYLGAKDGDPNSTGEDTDNAATLGLNYNLTQNIEVMLNNSWFVGSGGPSPASGNMLTTLMLSAAF